MVPKDILAKFYDSYEAVMKGNVADAFPSAFDLDEKEMASLSHITCTILGKIAKEKGINQRTLAERVGTTPQTISDQLKKLERRDYVVREYSQMKNQNLIFLTPKGVQVERYLEATIIAHAERVCRRFSREELATLHHLLSKLEETATSDEAPQEQDP